MGLRLTSHTEGSPPLFGRGFSPEANGDNRYQALCNEQSNKPHNGLTKELLQ